MRILFVAFPNSVHTARWMSQILGQRWDIHLFPSTLRGELHQMLKGKKISFHYPQFLRYPIGMLRLLSKKNPESYLHSMLGSDPPLVSSYLLSKTISRIKPDIVHTLEIQHAGYLMLEVKRRLGNKMPTWIVGNWGSDIYLFGQLPSSRERVRAVLEQCDYYTCECERDVRLALDLGLKGIALPVISNAGGFDLEKVQLFRGEVPPSERRQIVLKGYQGWAGRALVGLRAIELCADQMQDYRVVIPLASEDVALSAELVSHRTGIAIDILPPVSHEEMLRAYSQARAYVGLSISDAISQSMLEALVMGAFPIQSSTSCADEWIKPGISGLIVPPEDPHIIAKALRRALSDDEMVDSAAAINWQLAKERLDEKIIRPRVIAMYERVLAESQER